MKTGQHIVTKNDFAQERPLGEYQGMPVYALPNATLSTDFTGYPDSVVFVVEGKLVKVEAGSLVELVDLPEYTDVALKLITGEDLSEFEQATLKTALGVVEPMTAQEHMSLVAIVASGAFSGGLGDTAFKEPIDIVLNSLVASTPSLGYSPWLVIPRNTRSISVNEASFKLAVVEGFDYTELTLIAISDSTGNGEVYTYTWEALYNLVMAQSVPASIQLYDIENSYGHVTMEQAVALRAVTILTMATTSGTYSLPGNTLVTVATEPTSPFTVGLHNFFFSDGGGTIPEGLHYECNNSVVLAATGGAPFDGERLPLVSAQRYEAPGLALVAYQNDRWEFIYFSTLYATAESLTGPWTSTPGNEGIALTVTIPTTPFWMGLSLAGATSPEWENKVIEGANYAIGQDFMNSQYAVYYLD